MDSKNTDVECEAKFHMATSLQIYQHYCDILKDGDCTKSWKHYVLDQTVPKKKKRKSKVLAPNSQAPYSEIDLT